MMKKQNILDVNSRKHLKIMKKQNILDVNRAENT